MESLEHTESGEYRRTLFIVRWVLPSVLTLSGFFVLAIEPHGPAAHGALGIIGAGLASFLFAFLAKLSMSGDAMRAEEEANRRFFDAHRYWPDEDPSMARGGFPNP